MKEMKKASPAKPRKEYVAKESADVRRDAIAALGAIIPAAVTEGKVDFEQLKQALGEESLAGAERYSFSWAGKRDAIRILQTPSRATLIPAPKESVDFENTGNLFIEGDNLEVLKLLYKPYFGRVKMIYIDPPYNTGNDFIYPDNFADPLDTYLKLTGQKDSEGNLLTSNPETSGHYHSAWLSMMYPRLFLARQLLTDDGMIFISIDDNEVHNLRMVMNAVFGEENFVESIIWKKRYGGGAKEKHLVSVHEYILLYAKNKTSIDSIFIATDPKSIERYYKFKDENFELRGPYRTHPLEATKSVGVRKNLVYSIPAPDGSEIWPKRQWWWERERTENALRKKELEFIKGKEGWTVHSKQYLRDETGRERQAKAFSLIDDVYTQHGTAEIEALFGDSNVFPFPKPTGLIKPLVRIANLSERDIVLDFFAGSAATAQAVMELNLEDGVDRKFVLVQLPQATPDGSAAKKAGLETIAHIGEERIRRVIKRIEEEGDGKLALKSKDGVNPLGLKIFKLAVSNYRPWTGVEEKDPDVYFKTMEHFVDPLLPGWKPENLIWEVAIKEGYGLNSTIEKVALKENAVFKVTDTDKGQSFHICLDAALKLDKLKGLGLGKDDLFVCRDAALDDEAAANLALQCRLKTI